HFDDPLICCTNIVFFFQADDGIRDFHVTGVQTCALPIFLPPCEALSRSRGDVHLLSTGRLGEGSGVIQLLPELGRRALDLHFDRSEERRVGKEWMSQSRLWHEQENSV